MLGQAGSSGCLPLASQASPGSCGWAMPLLQVCPLDCGSSVAPRMKCSESAKARLDLQRRSSHVLNIITASPVQQCWDALGCEWFYANQNGTHVLRHVRATTAHTPHPHWLKHANFNIFPPSPCFWYSWMYLMRSCGKVRRIKPWMSRKIKDRKYRIVEASAPCFDSPSVGKHRCPKKSKMSARLSQGTGFVLVDRHLTWSKMG